MFSSRKSQREQRIHQRIDQSLTQLGVEKTLFSMETDDEERQPKYDVPPDNDQASSMMFPLKPQSSVSICDCERFAFRKQAYIT